MDPKLTSLKTNSLFTTTMPFLAVLLLFVTATMPYIHPLTPRINSDLFAFGGLALFGWFTHQALERQHQTFGWNGLSLLCGFWLLWACVQYIFQINTGYFSDFLISIFYLAAVILLTGWVGMWVQAQRSAELARAVAQLRAIERLRKAGAIA